MWRAAPIVTNGVKNFRCPIVIWQNKANRHEKNVCTRAAHIQRQNDKAISSLTFLWTLFLLIYCHLLFALLLEETTTKKINRCAGIVYKLRFSNAVLISSNGFCISFEHRNCTSSNWHCQLLEAIVLSNLHCNAIWYVWTLVQGKKLAFQKRSAQFNL